MQGSITGDHFIKLRPVAAGEPWVEGQTHAWLTHEEMRLFRDRRHRCNNYGGLQRLIAAILALRTAGTE